MEVYKDLLTLEKSKFKVVLGILFIILAFATIILKLSENKDVGIMYWFFLGAFGLNGVVFIIEGKGFSSSRIFGKAFLLINYEKIVIKMRIIDKERKVFWSEVKSINYSLNNYHIETTNGELLTINLSKFNYCVVQKIKESVNQISKENKISIMN